VDLAIFDKLEARVEALLDQIRTLKGENQSLKSALEEKEASLRRLVEENEAALAAKAEARQRLEALLQRIEGEVGQV
jgi:FtsZ-binding cell division protein ZapB